MAIILQKSIFFHTPKTGGSWVREVLQEAATVQAQIRKHPLPRDIKHSLYSFTFVRHPLTWYRSYFTYRIRTGWKTHEGGIDAFASDDFEKFLTQVVDNEPGYLSLLYDRRIGHKMDYIGKKENLLNDLITALRNANEKFDEEVIQEKGFVNVTEEVEVPEYPKRLAQKVLKAEKAIIERFEYSTDVARILEEDRRFLDA